MTKIFRLGEQVVAFDPKRQVKVGRHYQTGGWFKAVIVKLQTDGDYLVRWTPAPDDGELTSSVDADKIRHN